MSGWIWIIVSIGALVAVDQLLLWAERRGWVYWRKTKGRRGGLGDVFSGVEASINPRAEHVQVAKEAKKREDRSAGDPPSFASSERKGALDYGDEQHAGGGGAANQ